MAPGSPVIIDEALRKRRKKKIIVKSVFGSLAAVLVVLAVLYFALPVYKLGHTSFYGCSNFQNDDVISLSGYSSSTSYLFVDDTDVEENVVSNSNGLIREVESGVGFFSSEIFVREDYPVCTLASESQSGPQYPSLRTYEEILEACDSLSLDSDSVASIRAGLVSDYQNSSLPLLYMPSDAADSLTYEAVEALGDIPKDTINGMYAVQFSANMSESLFEKNLLDVLFSFENSSVEYYIVLEGIQVEDIGIIFADDRIIDEGLPEIEEAIISSGSGLGNMGSYEFSDPELTLGNVFHFSVSITDDEIEINRVAQ